MYHNPCIENVTNFSLLLQQINFKILWQKKTAAEMC